MSNFNMDHPSPASPGAYATCAFDQAVQLASQGSKGRPRVTKREHLQVEELVLKRCWLARYWGLAARLGVYPAVAHKKHAVWAAFAPRPNEVVLSAGQKAKSQAMATATEERLLISLGSAKLKRVETTNFRPDPLLSTTCEKFREEDEDEDEEHASADRREGGLREEGSDKNIDSRLLVVEEGLRELAGMKVEQAVLLKISHNQNPALIWFGLSGEQVQDIRFKQAWLLYYWRRTVVSGMLERDVAMERFLFWMDQTNKPTTYEDAVTVQRGLLELRSLGLDS